VKVLVDLNVVLDVLLNRPPWVDDSRRIWDAHYSGQIQGHLIATSITNLHYVAGRLAGQQIAMQCVARCLATFDVIPVDRRMLTEAAALPGADFEDNVAIRCAVAAGIEVIVTRDRAGLASSPVPTMSPPELLARLPESPR
jgi:predicted nucleic acid-binding protein